MKEQKLQIKLLPNYIGNQIYINFFEIMINTIYKYNKLSVIKIIGNNLLIEPKNE